MQIQLRIQRGDKVDTEIINLKGKPAITDKKSNQKSHNMESLAPNIFVKNINDTIKYYQHIGFEVAMTNPEQGDFEWAMMTCGNVSFMFQTFESLGNDVPEISRQPGGSLLFYIQVNGIRNLFEKVKDKVTIIKDLEKTFYGATEFSIQDNNGYILTFAEDEK